MAYAAGFYQNLSPYKSFGSSKFMPELSKSKFLKILKSKPKQSPLYKSILSDLYPQVKREIFSIEKPYRQLGFPEEGGTTGYFSRNMTKADLKVVTDFLQSQKIDVLNTRAFKKSGRIVITVGSIEKKTEKAIQF